VTDITGATGMKIIRAIVAGKHRRKSCLSFAMFVARFRATIREALTGNYRAEHVFALKQALDLGLHQIKIAECDSRLKPC